MCCVIDGSYWTGTDVLFKLEATGYALLTLVKIKDFAEAEHVVRWLQKHQRHMGDYGSSQVKYVSSPPSIMPDLFDNKYITNFLKTLCLFINARMIEC